MIPEKLILRGFTGIRSGTGKDVIELDLAAVPSKAQLIAIVGPNGKGKTTILDNLHPYRVMPSRSTTLGPTGFSYWDHICAPTAEKDFFWRVGNRRYRSTFTFKAGNRQKADYYLFAWDEERKAWAPAKAPDGTPSDGKTETYDRCLNAICGVPEAFFTSQFSSQGRKFLSAYSPGDIKSVLSSILNHEHLRALAAKANTVGKMLKLHLDGLQDDLSKVRAADGELSQCDGDLITVETELADRLRLEQEATVQLDDARRDQAALLGKRDAQVKEIEERAFLLEQVEKARMTAESQVQRESESAYASLTQLERERHTAEASIKDLDDQIARGKTEVTRLQASLAQKERVAAATEQLAELRTKLEVLDSAMSTSEERANELRPLRRVVEQRTADLAALQERGCGQANRIATLKQTASLIADVPCVGHAMQSTCPLLSNARDAQRNAHTEEKVLHDMRAKYRTILLSAEHDKSQVVELDSLEAALQRMSRERRELVVALDAARHASQLKEVIEDAERRLPQELEANATREASRKNAIVQLTQIGSNSDSVKVKRDAAITAIKVACDNEVRLLEDRIAKLAVPVSDDELAAGARQVTSCTEALARSRVSVQVCRDKKQAVLAKIEALRDIKARSEETVVQANRLSDEIAKWKLLEKGFGNDGLVALSIDDVGPEISAICNDLLKECYGGRFSVRIETQSTTTQGAIRETFEILVTDNHRDEKPKALKDMSGGEKVWVNECLVRAIALHVAETHEHRHATLFSDEADGALDPERKRQFMQMKRMVLKRGGYDREYFISHTPELCEMADHIIDVNTL